MQLRGSGVTEFIQTIYALEFFREMREAHPFLPFVFVLFAILFVVFIVLVLVFGNRCPKCKSYRALRETGNKELRPPHNAFFEEKLCRYCGHREWEEEWTSGHPGGG
jgi:hypothetical protein